MKYLYLLDNKMIKTANRFSFRQIYTTMLSSINVPTVFIISKFTILFIFNVLPILPICLKQ